MKQLHPLAFVIIITSFFYFSFSHAQVYTGIDATNRIGGATRVVYNESRKSISFIELNENFVVPVSESQAWLSKSLKFGSDESYSLQKTETDRSGYTHYRYKQLYRNIPVEYGVYYAHAKNGRLVSANGERYDKINVVAQPYMNKQDAYMKALEYFQPQQLLRDQSILDPAILVVLPLKNSYYLTYKFDLYAEVPHKRAYIYVDANTGKVLKESNRITDGDAVGSGLTMHNGPSVVLTTDSLSPNSFRLRETGRGLGINTLDLNNGTSYPAAVDFTDTDNLWNTTTNMDHAANDAHFGAEKTYDFYFDNFGRDSYDNAGAIINSYVHYSTGYVNAFWNGTAMTYGDGNGTQYYPLTSLEIIGHEITHAVTENTAGLIYSGESGALNESFSDIFGNTIRFLYSPAYATWLIGDQIVVPGSGGAPFRSMTDPNLFDCPDTYGGLFWNNGDIVHFDSGVQNFWYYLLSTGGSGTNDIGNAYLVNGIGLNDAMAIAYRNLSVYLTPNSTFMDARNGAIQSAIDLFGPCSNQAVQTTNAWYAVGVGGLFSNSVIAGFNVQNNTYCVVPAIVPFINTSLNATSYQWDFGDGGTSASVNPSHTYNSAGVYTVQLIASGTGTCASVDTLIMTNLITVTNGGGPISASCTPSNTAYCCGVGITNFQFNTINKTSLNASEGYKDFTCSNSTIVTAGDAVAINITTGITTPENVKVFIDYNNDGSFNNTNELVFSSVAQLQNHFGVVNTPVSATLNTPLRLRVMDDRNTSPIANACATLIAGQAEDYTITFVANTQAPEVDFTSDITVVNTGGSVQFYDLSIHAPTTWEWSFPGGTPTSSFAQNPVIAYNTVGVYPVELKVTNAFGADSVIKAGYITVVNFINMCSGTPSTTALNGILYDSGGPTGSYQNNEVCTLLIEPLCADSITLSFSAFSTESGFDYFNVYDGTSTAGTLLMNYAGGSIPPSVTATSGAMFIRFTSDGSVLGTGWEATWSTVTYSTIAPVAAFSVNDTTPPLNVNVQFTDLSTNTPNSWLWDFGDGNSATAQNPTHAFTSPGPFTVQLIAFSCSDSDTITNIITVQPAPGYSSDPDSINVSINCGDSITVPIMIVNSGPGDLEVYTNGSGGNVNLNVLALTYGVDLVTEYPNTIAGINQYFTNYTLTTVNTTSPASLQAALAGMDVFLMPEPESGTSSVYTSFAPVLQNYVNDGGTVIMCGAGSTQTACIFNTGLFSGVYAATGNGAVLNIVDPTHPILDSVLNPLTGPDATYVLNLSNPDLVPLVTHLGNEVVAYRQIGNGYVVFLAFDFYSTTNNANRIVSNAVRWAQSGSTPPWISTDPDTLAISAGDTSYINVTINSTGLDAGSYTYYIVLSTNDPLVPFDTIPVTMTISGPAAITMSDTCINFGSLLQNEIGIDSVLIVNQGCDTLDVSSITASLPEFTIQSPTTWSLAPHDSTYITVAFSSAIIGSFNGFLTILNNDEDTTICLIAITTGAPVLEFSPDSINVNVNCNDSIVIPVMIVNSGLSDLEIEIDGSSQNQNLQVLALQYGTDLTTEYPNTISGINQYFTNYTLTTVNTTSPATLQSELVGKNVFLMTEPENGTPSVYTGFAPVLQNFVANGGTVIFCGADNTQIPCIFNTGLLSGSYFNNANGNVIDIIDPTHPIMNGVIPPLQGTNATFAQNLTNLDIIPLVTFQGNEVVAYRSVGSGYVVYLGFDYFASSVNVNRIVSNTIQWAQSNAMPPWISTAPDSMVITPGDTSYLYVTLNSTGLNAGTYTYDIIISTNDPLHPTDTIPVTMNVVGAPEILLADSCINFGSILQNATALDSILIVNTGCDSLVVTSMIPSTSEFTVVSAGSWSLAPHDSTYISIEFSSPSIGLINGFLTIFNNDQDTTICLIGNALGAPIYSVSPDSINVNLSCGDSITIPVTIYNTGLSDLYIDIYSNSNGQSGDTTILVIQETPSWSLTMLTYLQNDFGITPTVINSSQIPVTDFTLYDVVITVSDESTTYYSNISANVAKFNAYVNGGGLVQYQMATQGGTNISLAGGGIMTYGNNQNQNLGMIPTHPILSGLTNPLNGSSANHCYISTLPSGSDIITTTGTGNFPTTIEYDLGNGSVIASGMTWEFLHTGTTNSQPLLGNAIAYTLSKINAIPDWIDFTPETDTISAGDSTIIYVTMSTIGLDAGTYTAYLVVTTNDPLVPFDTIPVTMTISGGATISLGDTCIDFGTVLQNSTVLDSVLVVNHGCDTLHVSSVTTSGIEFTLQSPSAWTLPPHDSTYITVAFNSASVGTFNGQLTILNNVQDTTICLTGTTVGAPFMEISPDSIYVTLACNDSIVVPIMIINSGLSDLTVETLQSGQAQTLEVLALQYGTDLSMEFPNTITGINQYFTNYNLTTINTTSASALQTALAGKDVFLMTEPETGTASVYSGFATILQNFVSNGGTAILCGADQTQAPCIFNTGLFSGAYATNGSGATLTIVNASHPLLSGIVPPIIGTNATHVANLSNIDAVPLVTYLGNEVLAYRPIGSGNAVFIAYDYFASNNNNNQIVANAVSWAQSNGLPPWIDTDPDSVVVAPGDTSYIYVTINSTGMTAGTYTHNLVIVTNDPLHPFDTIPVTMVVVDDPVLALSDSCLDFGNVVQFSSVSDSLLIYNEGCDDLIVTNMSTTASEFVVQAPLNFTVAPGDSAYVVVTFSPLTAGTFNGTLTIFNNDQDTTICLTGSSGLAPALTIQTISITELISACDDSVTVPLSVINSGGGMLNVNFSSSSPWIAISPVLINVAAGDTVTTNVTLYSSGLPNGIYSANVILASNDPINPSDSVLVSFTIAAPPCMINYLADADSCSGLVLFNDLSLSATSWLWNFGDSNSSALQNPSHQYASAGTYTVELLACNSFGCDSLEQIITISSTILADFTYSGVILNTLPIQFTDNSTGATSWSWNFGDSNTSNLQNPVHTYALAGTYIVTLVVSGPGCTMTYTDTLVILGVGISEMNDGHSILVFPNPSEDDAIIQFTLSTSQTISLIVYDVTGKQTNILLNQEQLLPGTHQFKLEEQGVGIYYIRFFGDTINETVRWTKLK